MAGGQNFDFDTENQDPIASAQGVTPSTAFETRQPAGLRFLVDKMRRLITHSAVLTSPQSPGNTARIATVQEQPDDSLVTAGLCTNATLYAVANSAGTQLRRLRMAGALDSTLGAGGFYTLANFPFSGHLKLPSTRSEQVSMGSIVGSVTSAVHAANVVSLDLRNLRDTLAIYMTCSAGTATLVVEVSHDATTYVTLDSIAAAASTAKQYSRALLGTTIALDVLAFRYVRITAGDAGVGNTTTLLIGAK